MSAKQELDEVVDRVTTFLAAFAVSAVVWVALDLLAQTTNVGFFGFFASIFFIAAIVAMAAVLVTASSLLTE